MLSIHDRIMWYLSYIDTVWPSEFPGLTIKYGRKNYGPLSIYVIVGYDGFYVKRVFHVDDMINDDAHFDLIKDTLKAIRDEVIEKGEKDRRNILNSVYGMGCITSRPYIDYIHYRSIFNENVMPKPKKIILNDPATIILWSDNTKTIVKKNSKDKKFDPEKGIALCYMKKALGNKGNYNNVFKDWIK